MTDIILDTDIGVDCDDAVALGLTLNAEREGKIRLLAITASTTREGATATIDAICDFYGEHKPIATMKTPLACDRINAYARAVMDKYGTSDTHDDAIRLLRSTLAQSENKVTVVALGPLTNIAALLKSAPDDISPLDGIALVSDRVEKLFVMGGSFRRNNAAMGCPENQVRAEWNVLQDVKAAKFVTENSPVETVFVPHEAGANVFTVMGEGDNPVWYAMRCFARHNGDSLDGEIRRQSWDPITCLAAFDDLTEWFDFSEKGRVTVSDLGVTEFESGDGNARFLVVKGRFDTLASYISTLMK